MKRILTVIFFLLAAPLVFGGVAYRFETMTRGLGDQRISGTVVSEGPRMRVNVATGDGVSFPNGSFVLADGTHVTVFDPNTKTYYDMTFDPLSPLKSMLGDAVSMSNERSSVRDLGNGHSITQSSYDMNVALMDKKVKMHVTVTTESWTTDKYPASASIGKVLASDPHAPKGFPLKQVTTFRLDQNGQPIEVTSTTTVSEITTKPIPATDLAMPAGYRKVESPMERAMKSMGR
ncbi:MAG TPA: hypothetical protein VGJ82_11495 [Thermoanaerobaculia bacterium]